MISREELFFRLDMDGPEDLAYFEQFAELVELDEDVAFDDFYKALSLADPEVITEINENYFTEIEKGFPEDCDDFMENIRQFWDCLKNLAPEIGDDSSRREYAEQLYKFHDMFTAKDGASVDGVYCSVMEALAESRASKLENTKHVYDFENSMDCVPDYISMRLGGYDEYESDDTLQDD